MPDDSPRGAERAASMNKEPMIYAVAGMVFGFVLGYMAANMGDHAAPRPAPPPGAVAAGGLDTAPSPAARRDAPPSPPDPNELKALESLATREKKNVQAR